MGSRGPPPAPLACPLPSITVLSAKRRGRRARSASVADRHRGQRHRARCDLGGLERGGSSASGPRDLTRLAGRAGAQDPEAPGAGEPGSDHHEPVRADRPQQRRRPEQHADAKRQRNARDHSWASLSVLKAGIVLLLLASSLCLKAPRVRSAHCTQEISLAGCDAAYQHKRRGIEQAS